MIYFALIFGLAIGNFIFQYFGQGNYVVAFERTYFQAVALFAYWFCQVILSGVGR